MSYLNPLLSSAKFVRGAPLQLAMAAQAKALLAQAFCPGFLAAAGLSAFTALGSAPAQAAATSFTCSTSNGVPTTVATTDTGRTVPMIRWTSNAFDGAGWSPQRRCQEVSQRFESFRQQGRLAFITTGRMNSLPVICTAAKDGGACDGLLYTLKPSQDPTLALQRLFDVRNKARGPLNETNARLYVSVDELLASKTGSTTGTTGANQPLW